MMGSQSSGILKEQPGTEVPLEAIIDEQPETGTLSLNKSSPSPLKCLKTADKFVVDASNWRYDIYDRNGELMYSGYEESSLCQECCCCSHRSFVVYIKNKHGKRVMQITRPSECCRGGQSCTIKVSPGMEIGTVTLRHFWCSKRCDVEDADGNVLLKIDQPRGVACGSMVYFPVRTMFGNRVADIKKYGALGGKTTFSVKFPIDLKMETKALILGALIFLDITNFELQ
ncbi:hypothetical protein GCK32_003155 [Trichostrongylus colubriformis]|uniref:Phospholipid scramblase n=1 Tax=Trichostrongylus colubriformis TaxID=6319 RepID=A0AAN8G8X3_TRICO